jgi:hypothetical protein
MVSSRQHAGSLVRSALAAACLVTLWGGCSRVESEFDPMAAPGEPERVASTNNAGKPDVRESERATSAPPTLFRSLCHLVAELPVGPEEGAKDAPVPRVLVEGVEVENGEVSRATHNFANRLRVELNRAANGRIFFVAPLLERLELQRREPPAPWRLAGKLTRIEKPDPRTTRAVAWRRLEVWLSDHDTRQIAWRGTYDYQDTP